ncbi:MAG TPA: DUF1289 domain-containing protein [Dongiaceae bacterium]|jgi:hypothetical protein|nr:DUF1289 domain-containing protein [Dongiaceae bacterium]
MADSPLLERKLTRDERRRRIRAELAGGPPSPCISVCRIDGETGLCEGCARTIEEIRHWLIATPAEKEAILVRIQARRPR